MTLALRNLKDPLAIAFRNEDFRSRWFCWILIRSGVVTSCALNAIDTACGAHTHARCSSSDKTPADAVRIGLTDSQKMTYDTEIRIADARIK